MRYPTLPPRKQYRQILDAFGGYNRVPLPGEGEFYDMENLTSDRCPILSPRRRRSVFARMPNPGGLIAKDCLCYTDGTDFVMNQYRVDLGLSPGPKELTSMGAYVIILPDRKWINTLDLTDFGSLDAAFTSQAPLQLSLCDCSGSDYALSATGPEEPAEPRNQQLWLDTAETPAVLKKYTAADRMWVSIPATYVKLSCPGIGLGFAQYDGVRISGLEEPGLDGTHVLWHREDNALVISGMLRAPRTQSAPVTVVRRMPEVDFLIESGNRLWGCRYGISADGTVVNEIYCSKLGDFKNWNCFLGTAADSYAASCGTDGPFTGAVTHLGYPLFFKEHCVHKVYGSYPANFQIQATALRGVRRGSGRSLAIVGETLFYQSPTGICAYDGSLPVEVSAPLGETVCGCAVAGALGSKYYLSLEEEDLGRQSLFVYDTRRNLWHREQGLPIQALCPCRGELYALTEGRILALLGSGREQEESLCWYAVTGELGLADPDYRCISRLVLRLSLEPGAQVRVLVRYDGWGPWESLGQVTGAQGTALTLSLNPRRCRHLALKLQGRGDCRIYSLTKVLEKGSDRP